MKRNWTIGLTGPTGAGKSTVAGLMRLRGFAVVDADRVAREVTAPGSPVLRELAAAFGQDILNNGVLDRSLLARRAFSGPESTRALNRITHPPIVERMALARDRAFAGGERVVVLDGAQLFEAGADRICDFTVAVVAPAQVRMERLLRRDGLPREELEKRMAAQFPCEYYESRADMIIRNYPPFLLSEQLKPIEERVRGAG